ncbi:hypothetical protein [Streptomyces sp. NPDC053560]|uniref:effector-associated constant component EACC1 n=1 Tax=Streptomyces sp. NPDC053560 TaxID=3365711 RepID=UPI0037D0D18E
MTHVRLTLHGTESTQEFRSLHRWLRDGGPELRAAGVTVRDVGEDPAPGEMGGAFEVIQLLVEHGAGWGSLALAVAAWWEAHRPRSSVTFERDGTKVTLTGAELRDEETVRRALARLGREDAA